MSGPQNAISREGEFDELVGELAEEFVLRLRKGENPQIQEYVDRYPSAGQLIRQVLSSLAAVMSDDARETPNLVTKTLMLQPTNHSHESLGVAKLFGDYEIIDEIARGGMGVVYKARQKSLNRIVALKMIKSGEFANQEQVDRFYKEAEAAANLDHPGIVPVHEVGEINGQHYFTMGLVDGESLSVLLGNGPLPPKEAASFAKSIAEAVAYAHSKGVIHRDLKPGNVLISKAGSPRITDFGLAKRVEDDSELTSTGQVLGTPAYMPPEQAEGREIGLAADIYAIGVTLYCMLVGRPPFQAANVIETLNLVLEAEPVSPRTLNRNIPPDLETLCLKCLEKKVTSRYESADVLVAELGRFINGEPIKARPTGRLESILRWCKRKPAQAIATAAMILMAVGGPALWIQLLLSNRNAAISRVDTLLNAAPATIPLVLSDLDEEFSTVRTRLEQLDAQDLETPERLRVSLALLPSDNAQLEYLDQLILRCSYEELAVALDRMKRHGGKQIASDLWGKFRNDDLPNDELFRAGLALASLDPESDQWNQHDYEFLVATTLQEVMVYQPAIRQSMKPLAERLFDYIATAFDQSDDKTVREGAALAIFDFVRDANTLTDFAMKGDVNQFLILYPEVAKHAATDAAVIDKLIQVTKVQPAEDLNEARRIALGKRRAGAAACLLRVGHVDEALEVLRVNEDPESLTQFVLGCKDRGISVTELLAMLSRATVVTERYGLLLALGEFPIDAIPSDIRATWVDHIKEVYANDPSSGVHGVSGWLLRRWGLSEVAKAIEEREIPYREDREWFTLKINLVGSPQVEKHSYFTFVVFRAGEYEIGSPEHEADRDSHTETRRVVKISQPFAVLDREVRRGELTEITGFAGFNNEPVWMTDRLGASAAMNWYIAVKFCRGLSRAAGLVEDSQSYLDPNSLDRSKFPIDPSAKYPWDHEGPKNWPLDLSKRGFRLPTSAEWEIACRGGTLTRYGFGSDASHLSSYGWYRDSARNRGHRCRNFVPTCAGCMICTAI